MPGYLLSLSKVVVLPVIIGRINTSQAWQELHFGCNTLLELNVLIFAPHHHNVSPKHSKLTQNSLAHPVMSPNLSQH